MTVKHTISDVPGDVLHDVRKILTACLEKRKARICEEISSYPPPIPACDAQFNHLLEARREITKEIAGLARSGTDETSRDVVTASIFRLIEESSYLDDDDRRELRSRLNRSR